MCIASGPSLSLAQIAAVYKARVANKCRVIVINDSYAVAPWADVLYAADYLWWQHNYPYWVEFQGDFISCTPESAANYKMIKWVPYQDNIGLSNSHNIINTGSNSGYQAVNIAALMGAEKIILLGYDHKIGATGKHWFGEHPSGLNKFSDYERWIKNSWSTVPESAAAMGTEIVNCSTGSVLTMFRQSSLEAEIA